MQQKKLKFGVDREKVTKKLATKQGALVCTVSYKAGCFGIEPETVRSNLEKNLRGRAKGVQSEDNKRQKRRAVCKISVKIVQPQRYNL